MKLRHLFVALSLLAAAVAVPAQAQEVGSQVHRQSDGYEYPTDPAVMEKLTAWQDLKFGVIFHWGLYAVPGIVESWSICSEDWITRPEGSEYGEYKKWYWGLNSQLCPTQFDPKAWADYMADAGMKYMVFTTKHHDGFCMFDSKETDFTIAHGPFAADPRRDVARHVFDAFRDRGFWIGAYFSKPDWHCPWYWRPENATPDRRENYKRESHPEWWQQYVGYTQRQLREITTRYGALDILWLDGGWVSGDEIGLDTILAEARQRHPGLLAVDRAVKGRNENYQTPERGIPEGQLLHPWESCIPLSNDWGWTPRPHYKSAQRVINTLAEATAKGGALLLGIGPKADGSIEPEVVSRLHEIGQWMRRNGAAIYATRPTPHYHEGNIWFTQSRDGRTRYAIYALPEGETLSATITWHGNLPVGKVTLLATGQALKTKHSGDSVTVTLPRGMKAESFALSFRVAETAAAPLYKQPDAPIAQRVDDLLGRMTLAEKVGQLRCPLGWETYTKHADGTITASDLLRRDLDGDSPVGGYYGVMRADPWTQKTIANGLCPRQAAEAVNVLQRRAVEHTRLGIPLLLAEETPHGHMAIGTTVFPTGLCLASSWDTALMQRVGQVWGEEMRLQGGTMGYGPVLDIARDPRWSRTEETFGEDATLSARMGTALVGGMQGTDLADGRHIAATLKHFAAYGVSEGGLNGARTVVGERMLHDELLPPFRSAVEAGCCGVMTAYNAIDGVPCTSNRALLTDVLRGAWHHTGVVVSDLLAIDALSDTHHVASDKAEAAALALRAGVDIDLGAACYGAPLLEAVERGLVSVADIDSAVARVLTLKFRLGLFEHPYVSPTEAAARVHADDHRALALEAAREGIVLLKNDGTLPLSTDLRRIALIGPNADTPYNQLGDYTAPQMDGAVVTPLMGIRAAVGSDTEVVYVKGCAVRDTTSTDIAAAVAAAQSADATVLVVGGSSARDFRTEYAATGAASVAEAAATRVQDMDCGEGFDRQTLALLGDQQRLMEAVIATGKPVVVVYIEGRTLNMNYAATHAAALLTAWYPGEQGGTALADILFGRYNPSGRLPVSIARSEGQLPVYYTRPVAHGYMDGEATPLFAFGYGKSYTQFAYSDLSVEPQQGEALARVACTVTNVGTRSGAEVVQLYAQPQKATTSVGAPRLCDFQRITLAAGESRRLTFCVPRTVAVGVPAGAGLNIAVGAASDDLRLRSVLALP